MGSGSVVAVGGRLWVVWLWFSELRWLGGSKDLCGSSVTEASAVVSQAMGSWFDSSSGTEVHGGGSNGSTSNGGVSLQLRGSNRG